MLVTNYRDLRVWQAAIDLVEHIYLLTQAFPACEMYGLTSQMRRAAVSVASNIAEGHAREHTKEYLHHLSMATGSLAELDTQLEIAKKLGYLEQDSIKQAFIQITALIKQLYALRNSLQKRC